MIEAYPLTWPAAQPRTQAILRTRAKFKVPLGTARDGLFRELALLVTRDIVISSNVPTRADGLPYANAREPSDPGVAVYFDRRVSGGAWKPFVVACDSYDRFAHNLRAVEVTIEALRTIKRHGASSMLEQAFTGFAALPPASVDEPPWWEVLGVAEHADRDTIRAAMHELALRCHPDKGGTVAAMARINDAYSKAKALGRT